MRVIELQQPDEFREAFAVVHDLRTHLDETEYMRRIAIMRDEKYRMFVVRDDADQIVAAAGFKIMTTLYAGKVLHIYDLSTKADERSKGYGAALMDYILHFARTLHCDNVTLDSGLQRVEAHRFYEARVGMLRTGYAFRKQLNG